MKIVKIMDLVAWLLFLASGAFLVMIMWLLSGCTTAYKTADNTIEIKADVVYLCNSTNGLSGFNQELLYEQETGEVAIRAQAAEKVGP